jgi:ubiquinone biosynthesis protein
MSMFRDNFASWSDIVVPKVHWDFTSRAVLVADLLEGIKIDDFEALKQHQVDQHELARIGLRAGLHMFLVDGFFHGDPHPGNLIVLPAEGGEEGRPLRLGLFDFGMIGRVSEKHRSELLSCFISYLEGNPEAYIKHVLDISELDNEANVPAFVSRAQTILTGVMHKPTEKKGIAYAFYEVLMSGAQNGVLFPSDLVLLAKAYVIIENTGFSLWPDIDLEEELRPYLIEVIKNELDPARLVSDLKTSAFDSLYFLRHLPEQTQSLLQRLEKGEVGVKLNLQELRDLKEEFDRQNDVRVLALLAAALLIASAAVLRLDIKAAALGLSLGQIGFVVAIVVVLWLFVLIRKRP